MAKFSGSTVRLPAASSPVRTTTPAVNAAGAPGFAHDIRSELFLLAAVNLVGEDAFYERGSNRDDRFRRLVREVTAVDPAWVARFAGYLRNEMQMRSAAVVMACEHVKARLDDPGIEVRARPATTGGVIPSCRSVVASVLCRADEPGELVGYWMQTYGRNIPKPVKRGVSDAMQRLVNQYAALKYDGVSKGWRIGDVIELCHPQPKDDTQRELYRWLLDRRHHPDDVRADLGALPMIARRRALEMIPAEERARMVAKDDGLAVALAEAGMTWESLSGWLGGPMTAAAWQAVIPSMGYMALLRNLRNFDCAGISDSVARAVGDRIASPDEVARSRQFPFRFLSAYLANKDSVRWGFALQQALDASVANIPDFGRRNLVLIDTSGSMSGMGISARSSVSPAMIAALFGVCLARRCADVDIVGFATGVFAHPMKPGASVLPEINRFLGRIGEVGHGTDIDRALRQYAGHDRVFLFSDEQSLTSVGSRVPAHVPVYTFNLGGYATSSVPSGSSNRHEFGGFSDKVFGLVPALEHGRSADWPF
jgi:hypothetical protein